MYSIFPIFQSSILPSFLLQITAKAILAAQATREILSKVLDKYMEGMPTKEDDVKELIETSSKFNSQLQALKAVWAASKNPVSLMSLASAHDFIIPWALTALMVD